MAEEVKLDSIKKTQTVLNKFIKKPPLTEKLLKKPPFRFLHDIVTSIIKETGFLEGTFTQEELVPENVKDRESKVKFLTKLINAVKETTGITIKAKPSKIVAGLEVDETLELLQAIAKGINLNKKGDAKNQKDTNKKSRSKESSESNGKEKVKKEVSGKTKVKDSIPMGKSPSPLENQPPLEKQLSENHQSVDEKPFLEKHSTNDLKVSAGEVELDSEQLIGTPNDRRKRERKKSVSSGGGGRDEEGRKPSRERSSTREGRRRRESLPPPSPSLPNGDLTVEEDNTRLLNGHSEGASPPETGSVTSGRKRSSLKKRSSSDFLTQSLSQEKTDHPEKITADTPAVGEETIASGEPLLQKRPQTRRTSSRPSKGPLKAFAEKGALKEEEAGGESRKKTPAGPSTLGSGEGQPIRPPSATSDRPMTARRAPPTARPPSARPPSARPRSARPPSATPGAPKTRDRGDVDVDINKDQRESEIKEVVVITENEKIEDKENLVVVESPSLALNEVENIRDDASSELEGVLIDSILETQSELDKRKSNKSKFDLDLEGQEKRTASWEKECSRLRQGVQALTRATGPLGKLFDFLQEDVDLASRELHVWRKASTTYAQQLTAEQKLTEETLSKHRKKLVELDSLIEEQHDAIRSLKSSILTNDKKIQSHISRLPSH